MSEDVDRSGFLVAEGEDRGVGALACRDGVPGGGDGVDEAGPADGFALVGVERDDGRFLVAVSLAGAAGIAPTVISSVSFRSTITSGLKVRVLLPQLQAGSCYLAGLSNTTLS